VFMDERQIRDLVTRAYIEGIRSYGKWVGGRLCVGTSETPMYDVEQDVLAGSDLYHRQHIDLVIDSVMPKRKDPNA
jgi:hypothetical protein